MAPEEDFLCSGKNEVEFLMVMHCLCMIHVYNYVRRELFSSKIFMLKFECSLKITAVLLACRAV